MIRLLLVDGERKKKTRFFPFHRPLFFSFPSLDLLLPFYRGFRHGSSEPQPRRPPLARSAHPGGGKQEKGVEALKGGDDDGRTRIRKPIETEPFLSTFEQKKTIFPSGRPPVPASHQRGRGDRPRLQGQV